MNVVERILQRRHFSLVNGLGSRANKCDNIDSLRTSEVDLLKLFLSHDGVL